MKGKSITDWKRDALDTEEKHPSMLETQVHKARSAPPKSVEYQCIGCGETVRPGHACCPEDSQ
jgi:hypothetical protein